MPANLTADYRAAEAAFRRARDPKERLDRLRDMLRLIPKHKGTDHLQADIKRRIKELTEELAGPRKGGAHHGPATVVHPEGAAQVALLGPPNCGKSALHARLTGSGAAVAAFPGTTQHPQAGMLPFEDIHIQLVDLPALSTEHTPPWLAATLQSADAALLLADLGEPDCLEELAALRTWLTDHRITLTPGWDEAEPDPEAEGFDPFARRLPTLLLETKVDLLAEPEEELAAFRELSGLEFPSLAVSAESSAGLDALGPWLFEHLGIVRVYTKSPGRPFERERPFTLRRGQTVADVAVLVHKEIAERLKYARLWRGSGEQVHQVGRDYPVEDGDIVELHS